MNNTDKIVEILESYGVFTGSHPHKIDEYRKQIAQEINASMSDEYSRGYVDGVTWCRGELKRGLT